MGSNMQRQAVPLLRTESPLVGTGLEHVTARNAGTVVKAERGGVVEYADSEVIRIRHKAVGKDDEPVPDDEDVYRLKKFVRSNQNTCINQTPIVKRATRLKRVKSSRTVPRRTTASWPSAATCSARSCRGKATTSRTPS
jgi:DNA-directed RNA polymerase subunit beta